MNRGSREGGVVMRMNGMKSLSDCGRLLKLAGVACGISVFGAGCMTYPLIEESLAVIESEPLSAKYAPPAHELVEEEDPGAEGLQGTWTTGYEAYWRRTGDGLPDGHPSKFGRQPISESYVFRSDGTYERHVHYGAIRFCSLQNTCAYCFSFLGKWTYADGTLNLFQERITYEADSMMVSNKEWRETEHQAYKVDWYENGVIILRDEELPPAKVGQHVIVKIDSYGVRTARTFNIMGTENGRERGWIEERTSLVRFTKTSANK